LKKSVPKTANASLSISKASALSPMKNGQPNCGCLRLRDATRPPVGWEIEGMCGEGRARSMITSQPTCHGKPPTLAEIRQFMLERGFGFRHTRLGDAWFRREDGLLVSDAEPKNVVVTEKGLMPFDFIIAQPPSKVLRAAGIMCL
jgi:hypothetical protein